MKYYGVMCCEFDGTLEDLETEAEFKPKHEQSGFFFAKWFENPEARNKCREFLAKTIKEIQDKRK